MPELADTVPQNPIRRYSNTAATLHWLTVVLVVIQAILGFTFEDNRGLFVWHKTVGLMILLLVLARLAYRLTHRPPPYPPDLPKWERVLGTWNHRLFYAILILLPVGGLLAVSGKADGPTTALVFGIEIPVIPGVSKAMGETAGELHELLAFALIGLIVVHAAAALKHRFLDRTPAAGRMPPFDVPGGPKAVVGQG